MNDLYLAGGCFWGVEEYFRRIEGIEETSVGYINSIVESPSYEVVCSSTTKAAEGVHLVYNDSIITLQEILDRFYSIIDPYLLNRQGGDIGTQYRTGLYYRDEQEKEVFERDQRERQSETSRKIVVEIEPLENYYLAEPYHQQYLVKNPGGYCHIKLPPIK